VSRIFCNSRALILEGLAKAGVAPDDVTHTFINYHPDHTVNIALFPNAEVVDFWASYRGDLWRDRAEEYDIVPGITVLRTPGHTGTYVLTHLWWLEDMTPETDLLAWDQAKLEASRQKGLAIADWIIPGHGRVFKNPRKG
jgi:glyoxylase-like metal-dependent hydrolase (beta-lactamase superfamily II)